jgi:hypothetical protein
LPVAVPDFALKNSVLVQLTKYIQYLTYSDVNETLQAENETLALQSETRPPHMGTAVQPVSFPGSHHLYSNIRLAILSFSETVTS